MYSHKLLCALSLVVLAYPAIAIDIRIKDLKELKCDKIDIKRFVQENKHIVLTSPDHPINTLSISKSFSKTLPLNTKLKVKSFDGEELLGPVTKVGETKPMTIHKFGGHIWGIKDLTEEGVVLTSDNCLPLNQEDELSRYFESLRKENASELMKALKEYDVEKARKAVALGNTKLKDETFDIGSFSKLLKLREDALALKMLKQSFPEKIPINSSEIVHEVIYFDRIELLRTLMGEMVSVDVRLEKERTPLMIAVLYGNSEAVDFLLEKGADVNAIDSEGHNSLYYLPGFSHIVSIFAEMKPDNRKDIAKALFEEKIKVITGEPKANSIIRSLQEGRDDIAEMLLLYGVDTKNIEKLFQKKYSPYTRFLTVIHKHNKPLPDVEVFKKYLEKKAHFKKTKTKSKKDAIYLLAHSLKYKDLDGFEEAVKVLPADEFPNEVSVGDSKNFTTSLILAAPPEFLKTLLFKSANLFEDFISIPYYHLENSFVEAILESCDIEKIKLLPPHKLVGRGINVSAPHFRPKWGQSYKHCLNTLELKRKLFPDLNDLHLAWKVLQTNDHQLLYYMVDKKLFSESSLYEAHKNKHKPVTDNNYVINDDTKKYFNFLVPEESFKQPHEREKILSGHKLFLNEGWIYPLCGRYEDAILYKDESMTESLLNIAFCFNAELQHGPSEIKTYKIIDYDKDVLKVQIQKAYFYNARDKEDSFFNNTYYIKTSTVTSPFLFTDGFYYTFVPYISLDAIELVGPFAHFKGDGHACGGEFFPPVVSKKYSTGSDIRLPVDFKKDNAKIIRNFFFDEAENCGHP